MNFFGYCNLRIVYVLMVRIVNIVSNIRNLIFYKVFLVCGLFLLIFLVNDKVKNFSVIIN